MGEGGGEKEVEGEGEDMKVVSGSGEELGKSNTAKNLNKTQKQSRQEYIQDIKNSKKQM